MDVVGNDHVPRSPLANGGDGDGDGDGDTCALLGTAEGVAQRLRKQPNEESAHADGGQSRPGFVQNRQMCSYPALIAIFAVVCTIVFSLLKPFLCYDHCSTQSDWNPDLFAAESESPWAEESVSYHQGTNANETCRLALTKLCFPEYTKEMAIEAIRPTTWTCGDDHNETSDPYDIISFVHIFKASGTTIRDLFKEYALACRKTWVCLIQCTDPKLVHSIRDGRDWEPCKVKNFTDGRYNASKNANKGLAHISNERLRKINLFGGHIRIGTGDYLTHNASLQTRNARVRHVVFLRDAKHRYVSAMLYKDKKKRDQNENETEENYSLEEVVVRIKEKVRDARSNNEYFLKSESYLLTPDQEILHAFKRNMKNKTDKVERIEAKVHMMVENLVKYNAIVGMTEDMIGSMGILRHVLGSSNAAKDVRRNVTEVFDRYTPNRDKIINGSETSNASSLGGMISNPSEYHNISTSSVLQALAQDVEFDNIFTEYCKYEQILTDFALHMHKIQYDALDL